MRAACVALAFAAVLALTDGAAQAQDYGGFRRGGEPGVFDL